jgi:hypothetical protein
MAVYAHLNHCNTIIAQTKQNTRTATAQLQGHHKPNREPALVNDAGPVPLEEPLCELSDAAEPPIPL